jgi:hypothetical protein
MKVTAQGICGHLTFRRAEIRFCHTAWRVAMLSKCANPECFEQFRYLHQGKIFLLTPSQDLQATESQSELLEERFWLCDRCCKEMTIVWDGTKARVVLGLNKSGKAFSKSRASEESRCNEQDRKFVTVH